MNLEKNLNDFIPDKKSNYSKFYKDVVSKNIIKEEEVIDCIKTVMDPEIPVNLYDLGLIYNIELSKNYDVKIIMTLTTPNCPVAGEMPLMVAKSIKNLKGFKSVDVHLVWEPSWTKDMMSEDAKLALDIP